MIELAIVLLIQRKLELKGNDKLSKSGRIKTRIQRKKEKDMVFFRNETSFVPNRLPSDHDFEKNHSLMVSVQKKCLSFTDKIDMAAFTIFLFSYLVFNCAYVAQYM